MNATLSALHLHVPILEQADDRLLISAAVGLAVVGVIGAAALLGSKTGVDVPIIGVGSGPLAQQFAAMKSIKQMKDWVAEGYLKYRNKVFQVRQLHDWLVIINSPALIDELRRAPEEVLSFREAVGQTLQADFTMGDWRSESPVHVNLIRSKLTKSLPGAFPSVIDEIEHAFADEFKGIPESGWETVKAVPSIMRIVCRTSNRLFIGLPLCRDPEYVDLNVQYTIDVSMSSVILKQFPHFMRGLVSRFLTPMNRTYATAFRLMTPLVSGRLEQMEKHGSGWADKPEDMLQWLIEGVPDRERNTEALIMRMLRLNFAAIHTTAMSFTYALYHVAANPERWQAPLRAEVIETLSREGWTKNGVEQLLLMDSLFREVQRYHGLGAVSISRMAMRDYTFADGTHVPKGAVIAVPSRAIHHDASFYENPDEFNPFRFYSADQAAKGANEAELPNRMVATSLEYLPFGHGRHACPGRFWAANELKTMMAYFLLHFDIEMETPGVIPPEIWFGQSVIPNNEGCIRLRRREVAAF